MNAWHIGTLVCAFISLLVLIIALSTDYWLIGTVNITNKGYFGLWAVSSGLGRFQYTSVPGYFEATRAFLLIGMIIGAFSCAVLCAMFFRSQIGSFSLAKSAMISSFVTGFCVLIAMAAFAGGAKGGPYSWSFVLGWISCILFLITGGVGCKLPRETAA